MKSENEALKDKAKKNLGGAQKYLNLYENDQSNQNSSNYQKLSVAEIRKKFETLPLKPPQKTEVKKSTRNTVSLKIKMIILIANCYCIVYDVSIIFN